MSCRQVARPFSNGLSSGSIHDEIKVIAPIRSELEDLVNELPDGNIITVGAKTFPLRGSVVPGRFQW